MFNPIQTDQPATKQSEDCFQRYEFSKRIASIVAKPKIDKSLVVGLYGKWGEGKTTVMNFIQQELPDETIVVKFNPWLFSDEQHLLKSFFTSISETLDSSIKTKKERIGELLSSYSGAIGSVTQLVGFSTEGLEKLGDKLKGTSIEKLKKRVDDLIIQSGKNIVVFVDDIDRLDINEVQYIFKLVKLVGDFPRTSYILSFDEEMVSAALSPKYGGNSKIAGYSFLEKIIQIPIKIPKASKRALSKFTLGQINKILQSIYIDLDKEESNDFLEIFTNYFLPIMDNPRLGIRYANTLYFSMPLLKGEVNIVDLMIIEGLKIFYPSIYDFIRAKGHLFLESTDSDYSNFGREKDRREEIKTEISNAIISYDEKDGKIIVKMLENLFPQLKSIYSNYGFKDDSYVKWAKEKRICSGFYFDRYFSYSVTEGDIPDNYFKNLLLTIEKESIEESTKRINETIKRYSAFDLIHKFRLQEGDLNVAQSQNLAVVLAKIGYLFPQDGDIHFATTYAQSAKLIVKLVRNVIQSGQFSLVLKLLANTPSMEYAMEIHYWLMYNEQEYPDKIIFDQTNEIDMHSLLVKRFIKEMTDSNFFNLLSDGNMWRVLSWWSKLNKQKFILRQYWDKHLGNRKNPDFALKLLKVFTPTINSFGSKGKRTYKSGFYQSNFVALKEVVDVQMLNENLIGRFGMRPLKNNPSTISDRDPVDNETLVSIFQWFLVNA